MTLVIGHRGAPWDAPENTLASLRRALEYGLDGFEYDLQRTRDGEAVLLHDDTLDRTTTGKGPVGDKGLVELFGLDAGSWFSSAYMEEPIPAFDEAWSLVPPLGTDPLHLIELKDASLVDPVADVIQRSYAPRRRPLIISFHKSVCTEARDRGLDAMYLADVAHEDARRFVRDERISAFGCGPGGWTAPGVDTDVDWACQRWSWAIDDPEELLALFRRPLFGLNTNEPARALALRELVRLAPGDAGPPPLACDELLIDGHGLRQEVVPSDPPLAHPERAVLEPWTAAWCGDWNVAVRVRNPFAWPVTASLEARARGGAFEFESAALEAPFELAPKEERVFDLRVVGGSRSPGPDPRLAMHFAWQGRTLTFDTTLARRREALLVEGATRLSMLRESPGEPAASIVVSRRGRDLVLRIENPGGLADARLVARLGPDTLTGSKHLALRLPGEAFDTARTAGLDFALGLVGTTSLGRQLRRFGGGLPPGLMSGALGRLRIS